MYFINGSDDDSCELLSVAVKDKQAFRASRSCHSGKHTQCSRTTLIDKQNCLVKYYEMKT